MIDDGLAEFDQNSSEYVPVEELKAANDPRWLAMAAGEWDVGRVRRGVPGAHDHLDRVDHRCATPASVWSPHATAA